MASQIPCLKETPTSKQLQVNGKPFLMLGAELQNSSMTSARYMKDIWKKLTAANINTVLGNVTWEQIEPEEGKFDFTELDGVVKGAREAGLHLVLLWFGSFKNGLSSYVPPWVKTNTKRFPRAMLRKAGGQMEIGDVLSLFYGESQKADAKAFGKLMEHLKELDEKHSTVIMVQVENECGLLGDSRDASRAAMKKFSEPVPRDLIKKLSSDFDNLRPELQNALATFKATSSGSKGGSWEEVFGKSQQCDEIFMAYHYAQYVNQVASAGKAAYPLPLYTNVWQNYVGDDAENDFPVVAGGGGAPGDYPSGGAVINVIDIWHTFAPSLDFIGPDIYLNEYSSSCAKYRHNNQTLFIPEQRRDEFGARRIWKAYGSYQALGAAPFGIDTVEPELNPFKLHYGLLNSVRQLVLQAQRDDSSVGFYFDELNADGSDPSPKLNVQFAGFNLCIQRSFVFGKPSAGWGMVIWTGKAQNKPIFTLIGLGFMVEFSHPEKEYTSILRFEEKEVVDAEKGELRTLRMLNGDETRSGLYVIMPNQDPDYGGFPISITIPAGTMIAECEVYALGEEDGSA